MNSKNILFILTSAAEAENSGWISNQKTGFNLNELSKPFHLFENRHYHCQLASVKGGKCTVEEASDMNDNDAKWFLGAHGDMLENSRPITEFNPENFAACFFVGGIGTMWDFPYDTAVHEFAQRLYENNGVIGAVCHGPVALVNTKLSNGRSILEGKTIACFTNEEEAHYGYDKYYPEKLTCEDMVKRVGANLTKGEPLKEHVVRDERLVTGANPASAEGVACQMIELLEGTRRIK
jgi:putative intracellular protease/amidase